MQEMREEEIVGQVVFVVTVMNDDGLILNASIAKKKKKLVPTLTQILP